MVNERTGFTRCELERIGLSLGRGESESTTLRRAVGQVLILHESGQGHLHWGVGPARPEQEELPVVQEPGRVPVKCLFR